jgi:hypothetical protein
MIHYGFCSNGSSQSVFVSIESPFFHPNFWIEEDSPLWGHCDDEDGNFLCAGSMLAFRVLSSCSWEAPSFLGFLELQNTSPYSTLQSFGEF